MTWTFLLSMLYAMTALSTLTPTNKTKFHSGWTMTAVARLKIKVTHLFLSLSKQLTQADSMLQCPFIISTIVFKDLDWKLGHIATTNSTLTQVTLSLMNGAWKTMRPVRNFSPCLSLHIHNKYTTVTLTEPNIVLTTIKKHSCWFWNVHSTSSPYLDSLKIHSSVLNE
jgi:hypothetical protein